MDLLKQNIGRLTQGLVPLEIDEVLKITKYVVVGLFYVYFGTFRKYGRNKQCHVTIWYRPWLDTVEKSIVRTTCKYDYE